jgi:hypothetical protein
MQTPRTTRLLALAFLISGTAVVLVLGLRRHPLPGADTPGVAHNAPANNPLATRPPALASPSPEAAATVEKIRAALAAMDPILPGETENKAALQLLHWWAEIDPASALAYAHKHPAIHGRAELVAELFGAWLNTKRDLAITWATSLPRGELRSRLLPTLISLTAQQRPADALSLASELTGENRRLALSALFAEWSSSDPATAARQAERLPTTEERHLALRQVIGKWADQDLEASIAWIKTLPPLGDGGSLDTYISPLEILLEKWTAQAPLDATRYLASLPEGIRRIQMLSTAAGQWAEQNPRDALAWASGLSAETDRDVALRGVLAGVAQTDAEAAANLALSLPPGAAQQKGFELILDQWSATAPDTLVRWATTQLANSSHPETMPTVVAAWANADLPTLGDWLNALPPGDARDTGCVVLARHLAPTQPDLARKWVDAISDLGLRERQTKTLAENAGR